MGGDGNSLFFIIRSTTKSVLNVCKICNELKLLGSQIITATVMARNHKVAGFVSSRVTISAFQTRQSVSKIQLSHPIRKKTNLKKHLIAIVLVPTNRKCANKSLMI